MNPFARFAFTVMILVRNDLVIRHSAAEKPSAAEEIEKRVEQAEP